MYLSLVLHYVAPYELLNMITVTVVLLLWCIFLWFYVYDCNVISVMKVDAYYIPRSCITCIDHACL